MAASSVGLLVGASVGAACLGSHMARESGQRQDAARLMMASKDGTVDMAALDASGTGRVDTSALNIAMRFSRFADSGTENTLLAQNLTTIRTSSDMRSQRYLPGSMSDANSGAAVVRTSLDTSAPVNTLSTPAVRAAAAMNFKAATRSDSDCLTQAVYYEARGEGTDGMRAVAQVILNRVRHPAYPKSICGVVYQGAAQRISCQFSFVCNGAMGAPVETSAWRRAKKVSEAALAGYVMPSVGTSTSFHTTGVTPGWSGTMERVAQIGTHIFYQFRGRGARISGTADGVRPSDSMPQVTPPAATAIIAEAQTPAQTTALLTTLSKMQGASVKPVQTTAHVHGKTAQDIVAEVALPTKAVPVPTSAAKGAPQ
ncbi:cell wall hydrolase [Asticcacaulis sp. MM231]|uniref:cell wall hydrolase n=1 Tax=Asticcacaulis sp. MM231 TaxID=3157666 RepID=UPI0032D58F7D